MKVIFALFCAVSHQSHPVINICVVVICCICNVPV